MTQAMRHRSRTTSSASIPHLLLQLLLTTIISAATIPHPLTTTTTNNTGPIIFPIPDSQLTLEYHITTPSHLNTLSLRTCALRNQLWIESTHPSDPRYPHASQRLAPFNAPERFCSLPQIYLGVGYERQSDLLSWVDLMNVFRGLHMAAWEPWFYNFAGTVSVMRGTSSGSYEVSQVGMFFEKPVGWVGGNGTGAPAGVVAEAEREEAAGGGGGTGGWDGVCGDRLGGEILGYLELFDDSVTNPSFSSSSVEHNIHN
ncbi:MAG: hypothetical protein OHK93_001714 [Ramalina farinacea]|uniref:Uncharacterized protein n=1 Tax=Ramalina farinacea TaxID=258253 RepID=A0AA43QQ29_9LECA|nr:hypothetical protein [Ramalina farinacea]